LECSFSFCSNGTYLDISFFKQFSTQDFHIQLEPCGAQKDLEVLQQTRYVLLQPKSKGKKKIKKEICSNPNLSSWQKVCAILLITRALRISHFIISLLK
jgi:hypothetical protein